MKNTYYYFILVFTLNVQFFGAQIIKKDQSYISIEDDAGGVGDDKFVIAKDGCIYKRNELGKVVKYLPTGNIDTSFGVNGSITPPANTYYPMALSDNALYLVRNVGNVGIVKYDLNGIQNMSFGTNGVLNLPYTMTLTKVLANSDESLYVINKSTLPPPPYTYVYSVYKISPSGIIDIAFGTKDFGEPIEILRTTNNSLLVGYNSSTIAQTTIKKYLPDGTTDSAFANQGELIIASKFGNIAINRLNEIFVTVSWGLAKYTESGSIATGFDSSGFLSLWNLTGGGLYELDFDTDDKIVLSGFKQIIMDQYDCIGRLNVDGTMDYSFNQNGTSPYYLGPYSVAFMNSSVDKIKVINNNEFIILYNLRSGLTNRWRFTIKFIRTASTLSIAEAKQEKLQIYPNPISDILHIKLGLNEKLQKINIYAIDGSLVFTGTDEKSNIKFLSAGNYVVEIKTDKNTYSKKIVKK